MQRMQQTFFRSGLFYGAFALALALAACGGGSSTSTPATTKPSATASPTTSPSASGSASASPSAAPTPEYAFPAPQATMPSTNPTVTLTQGAVTMTGTFSANTGGSGTIDVNLGFNNGDITPAITPADNATTNTPIIYASFYNGTTNDIQFGTMTPKVVLTDTNGLGAATWCSLDVFSNNGGGSAWGSVATGTPAGNSVTIPPTAIGGSSTLDLEPGQQLVAVSCN
jgi:hypothetical protein